MKVLVCGSRGWNDPQPILERLKLLPADTTILHGGATGADALASRAAETLGLGEIVFLADWAAHGNRAGVIRNNRMLDQQPSLVIAFWDGTSPGTRHTITAARDRSIPVEVHS